MIQGRPADRAFHRSAGNPDGRRCAAVPWVLAACLATSPVGCRDHAPSSFPEANLVLLSIDTLRADALGWYGSHRATSPTIDALAAESLSYSNASAPASWTFPSHVGMLTGRHPWDLGLRDDATVIPPATPTLAQILSAKGFATAAFVDSSPDGFVGARRGFGRGFDTFEHAPHLGPSSGPGSGADATKYDMAATVDAAARWLRGRDPNRRFFLFLHSKSVHAVPRGAPCMDPNCFPYDKPDPFRFRFVPARLAHPFTWSSETRGSGQNLLWTVNRELFECREHPLEAAEPARRTLRALYDGGVSYVDAEVGRLRSLLEELGLKERTILVLTSDHGEAFGEHRFFMHQDVYETTLHVPLTIRLPRASGAGRISQPVVTTGLASRLLELLAIHASEASVDPPLPVRDDPSSIGGPIFSYYRLSSETSYQAYAIRQGPWKLIRHNPCRAGGEVDELYDLSRDPGETRPIADTEPPSDLRASLDRRLAARVGAPGEPSEGAAEGLRALGYVD